jgi:heme iron utilization protein
MTTPPPESSRLPALAGALVRTARAGILSTLSVRQPGWPFGSLAPYAVAVDGNIAFALSDLAEHTRNLRADSRASLFVTDPSVPLESQSTARMTLLGHVRVPTENAPLADARARYLARFPEADEQLTKLDFHIYVLTVDTVRFIGGFGRMAWLDGPTLRPEPARDALAEASPGILAHMNGDHADVLRLYCAAFRGRTVASAIMTAVDEWGFDVHDRDSNERFRFDFSERITSPDEVRKAVVAMARSAREKLGIAK